MHKKHLLYTIHISPSSSDPPKVKLKLGNGLDRDRISEGQDVYMDCDIRANPPIYKVEWLHNVSTYTFMSQLCQNHKAKKYNA